MKIPFMAETYLEPYQTSKMELFVKIVSGFWLLTIFAKRSILNIWQGSEYASARHGSLSHFRSRANSKHCLLKWEDKNYKRRYTYEVKRYNLCLNKILVLASWKLVFSLKANSWIEKCQRFFITVSAALKNIFEKTDFQ